MSINQPSLVQFEMARKAQGVIPPQGSNSFFDVGEGKINLFTVRSQVDNYRFDLFTDEGKVYTGPGNFVISGESNDISSPYRNATVITGTTLAVNQFMYINGGELNVYGTIELMEHSQLRVYGGRAITHPDSVLVIKDHTNLSVANGSSLTIYGRVDVHISVVNAILNAPNVILDSAAVMNVTGIDLPGRMYSFTDYASEIRGRYTNINTQGEHNFPDGRIGHIWRMGSPSEPSHVIGMNLQNGMIPLGDFRFSILGRPERTQPRMATVSDLTIRKGTTLRITEHYGENQYVRPELYLGIIIGNTAVPANCVLQGKIIADGINSLITVDREATLRIEEGGELWLLNGAIMRCTHCNDKKVLFINGTLIIDDIEQIKTFEAANISFGPKGKLIVNNPETDERRLLFTTPKGILASDLYRIFREKIDHVEYHISPNTGIAVDQYYENFSRDMTLWFGDRRIEKAIHDGILVWHDGAFIELYSHIIPWVNENSSLLVVGPLFKSFGSFAKDRLQDAANRLQYAGCGNILFRFINGDAIGEVTLHLDQIRMKRIMNNPLNHRFILSTDNEGSLFLRNRVSNVAVSNLIHPISRLYNVPETNELEFTLP